MSQQHEFERDRHGHIRSATTKSNRICRVWAVILVLLFAAGTTLGLLCLATWNNNRAEEKMAANREPVDVDFYRRVNALSSEMPSGEPLIIQAEIPDPVVPIEEVIVCEIQAPSLDMVYDDAPREVSEEVLDVIVTKTPLHFSSMMGGCSSYGRASAPESFNTESYANLPKHGYTTAREKPLSTFSTDVDTASYANVRRLLNQGTIPPEGAVRIEEMINYFDYDYPEPTGMHPFSVTTEMGPCPWQPKHYLVRIGLKGKSIEQEQRPPANLVFLLDVSGSMRDSNKLPLVKKSLRLLTDHLDQRDTISIVVYAGAAGMVLPPTQADKKGQIYDAIERLEAGGSTNGGAGIQLAYKTAKRNRKPGGVNRVILATDGDFNVGHVDNGSLLDVIGSYAKDRIYLSILGFGMGNYKDDRMETLSNRGNGNYAYIDTVQEAQKVLVEQMNGTLVTIAKDVKIQVEFNPFHVAKYRLIGYDNRRLKKEDFNDDKKDAGEIGAGHCVTAFYEIVPIGAETSEGLDPEVDELKYQQVFSLPKGRATEYEIMNVKLRYKPPTSDKSILVTQAVSEGCYDIMEASRDFRFATALAEFGLLLRDSEWKGQASYESVKKLAKAGIKDAKDADRRREMLKLVSAAIALLPEDLSSTR